jgi:uncharacterized membrane protein YuzA (DUF378 family)
MRRLGPLGWIAFILLFIGGINWGLIGLFDYNLVAAIFGETTLFTKIIYTLVGISAIYMLAAISMPGYGYDRPVGQDRFRQRPLNDRRRGERRHRDDHPDEPEI